MSEEVHTSMTALPTDAPAPAREAAPDPTRAVDPASALRGTVAEELVVLVAPTTGRFRPHEDPVGRWYELGALLGHVTGGKGRADEVVAPVSATVADLLVRPGQLVHQGQGLAWLRRPTAGIA